MADTTNTNTTAAPAATQPEALREAAKWLHAAYDRPPQTPECVAMLALVDAALAAPAAQEAEPVAYCQPDDPNPSEAFSWPGHCRQEHHTIPLYGRPPRPQADAGAVPGKVTPDMRRVFREAYRVGGFWADRLDYALDRMLAAAPQAPAAAVAPAEDEEKTQPWYDLAWKHGAKQHASMGGDELASLEFFPGDFEAFCADLAAAPTQEAEDAARYRYLRNRMEFQFQKGSNPTMGLAVRIVAQHHDPHADWMEPRFSASVDRAIDAARARQEGGGAA